MNATDISNKCIAPGGQPNCQEMVRDSCANPVPHSGPPVQWFAAGWLLRSTLSESVYCPACGKFGSRLLMIKLLALSLCG